MGVEDGQIRLRTLYEFREEGMEMCIRDRGMDEAQQILQSAGVQAEWNDTDKQYYAEWEADGGVYKIWLEDTASLDEKLKLIKSNQLAGVAAVSYTHLGTFQLRNILPRS